MDACQGGSCAPGGRRAARRHRQHGHARAKVRAQRSRVASGKRPSWRSISSRLPACTGCVRMHASREESYCLC